MHSEEVVDITSSRKFLIQSDLVLQNLMAIK